MNLLINERFEQLSSDLNSFLEALFAVGNEPYLVYTQDEELVTCNKIALKRLEKKDFKHLGESSVQKLFVPTKNAFYPKAENTLDELVEKSGERAQINKKERNYLLCSVHVQSFTMQGQKLYLILLKDRSQLQRAKSAEHYYKEFIEQFLTSLSHEFRTPMNNVIGFSDLLKETTLDIDQNEYMGYISNSANVMMKNIENLMELLQADTHGLKVNLSEFNTYDEFEKFSNNFYKKAYDKGVQLFFMIDPHLPDIIKGDHIKIEKVLQQLIDNSIKFTKGGGRIVINIELKESDDNSVTILYSVLDNGAGIEPEKLKALLKPFSRADSEAEKGLDGLGIGLSLSSKYLRVMGSKLRVQSKVKRGSNFAFFIKHEIVKKSHYELQKGLKVAIWAEDMYSKIQAETLSNYFKHFEVKTTHIDGIANPVLKEVDALFIITDHLSTKRIKTLKAHYNNIHIVPVIESGHKPKFEPMLNTLDNLLCLPLLPSNVHDVLTHLDKSVEVTDVPLSLEEKMEEKIKKSLQKKKEGTNILIAEDNPINLAQNKKVLAKWKDEKCK